VRSCGGSTAWWTAAATFLPHLLPVDPTLHWANLPGGVDGRDSRPAFVSTPGPYAGPVPLVTHLHGGHSTEESDGYAEAWYLPRRQPPHKVDELGTRRTSNGGPEGLRRHGCAA
jgi:hypothetical protein